MVISMEKEVRPARSVEYIWFVWDAQPKTVSVPPDTRRREYRRAVKNLLRHVQSKTTWQHLIGKLGFLREGGQSDNAAHQQSVACGGKKENRLEPNRSQGRGKDIFAMMGREAKGQDRVVSDNEVCDCEHHNRCF